MFLWRVWGRGAYFTTAAAGGAEGADKSAEAGEKEKVVIQSPGMAPYYVTEARLLTLVNFFSHIYFPVRV